MVLFQLIDNELFVLLINRANEPFKDMWALPGGYNPVGETTLGATKRVLKSKAGIDIGDIPFVEQVRAFDTVARDPRGHAVSVTYMGLARNMVPQAGKTTHNPQFYPVNDLPELAFDHADIIRFARDCLITKIANTSAVYALLPHLFTLSQLQAAYEAVFGRKLDKRNFRKKFLSFGLIKPSNELHREGAHRPARLYTFKKQTVQDLSRGFD